MIKRIKNLCIENIFYYVLLVAFSIPSIYYIMHPGFFPIHDDTQVLRVNQMAIALSDGMFPVRWARDMGYGYGYPIFTYYAPLAYYIGGFFNLIGLTATISTKIMMAFAVILSAITMFILSREFFGNRGALVSSLLYLYAPYHAVNIYIRGAVGEYYAYALFPLILYSIWSMYKSKQHRYIYLTEVSLALLILSHNLSAMMFAPVLAVLSITLIIKDYKKNNFNLLKKIAISFLLGLTLSSFYWIPAVFQINLTNVASQLGGGAKYSDNFVCVSQLWNSSWGFGGSVPGCVDGMSFRMGKLHVILAIISILLFAISFKKKDRYFAVLFATLFLFISIFMTLEYSKPIWDFVKPFSYIQYPWRYLSIVALSSSFVSGFGVYYFFETFNKKFNYEAVNVILGVLIIVPILVVYGKLFAPQVINNHSDVYYLSPLSVYYESMKLTDEYLPSDFVRPTSFAQVKISKFEIPKNVNVLGELVSTDELMLRTKSDMPYTIKINQIIYPGWKLILNNSNSEYKKNGNGISINVNKGENVVILKYIGTDIERVANIISFVGVVCLFIGIIHDHRRNIL